MPCPVGSVDAILMASGFSRRFGPDNKLLAPFLGKPLLCRPLELVTQMGVFSRVYLVAANPDVCRLAMQYPVTVLENKHPENGAIESIRLGVTASKADYYLFLPCDQPLLDEHTIDQILALRQPGGIVRPQFGPRPGSPVLFSSHYQNELAALKKGQHARDLIARHPDALITLELESENPLLDVDVKEDLQRISALL